MNYKLIPSHLTKGLCEKQRTSLYNNKFEKLVIVKQFLIYHSASRDASMEKRQKWLLC